MRYYLKKNEEGAMLVELALVLPLLFFFFALFFQIVQVMIVHEQASFAAFAASRTYTLPDKDERNARSVVLSRKGVSDQVLMEGAEITFPKCSQDCWYCSDNCTQIKISKNIDNPIIRNSLLLELSGRGNLSVSSKINTFKEPSWDGRYN